MSEPERFHHDFQYKGNDLIKGGELVDLQVASWYKKHSDCRVTKLSDHRIMEITKEYDCVCSINIEMEFEKKQE